jgi:hypothetical protein
MFAYIISGALEGSLLARRKLRLLAASHVTNFVLAVAALRAIAGQPGFALVQVWQIYFAVNLAKVIQFGTALEVGGRQARREEARRDKAEKDNGSWDGARGTAGGGDAFVWDDRTRPELGLVGREAEPRQPRVLHVSEEALYELISEAMPDSGDAQPRRRRMQP